MKTKELTPIMFRADESFKRRLKAETGARGTNIQSLMIELIEAWLKGHNASPETRDKISNHSSTIGDDLTEEEAAAARTLVEMMRAGDRTSKAVLTLVEQWGEEHAATKSSRDHRPRKRA